MLIYAYIPVHRKNPWALFIICSKTKLRMKKRERLLVDIPWQTLKILFVKLLYVSLCIPPPIVFQPFLVCANYFTRATDIAADLTSGLKTVYPSAAPRRSFINRFSVRELFYTCNWNWSFSHRSLNCKHQHDEKARRFPINPTSHRLF